MINSMKLRIILSLFILISPVLLYSQETAGEATIDWNVFNMGGVSWSRSYRTISDDSESESKTLKYQTDAAGLNYTNFTGSRIGFFSQLTASFPFRTRKEGENWENNAGFVLDYSGAVGWTFKAGRFGFMPFAGFHTAYTFLSRDPFDDGSSSHMASFGLSLGCNFLFYLNKNDSLFGGLSGYIDTIEFTSASYDSRNVQAERKMAYMISLGYAYTPGTVKKTLQPEI